MTNADQPADWVSLLAPLTPQMRWAEILKPLLASSIGAQLRDINRLVLLQAQPPLINPGVRAALLGMQNTAVHEAISAVAESMGTKNLFGALVANRASLAPLGDFARIVNGLPPMPPASSGSAATGSPHAGMSASGEVTVGGSAELEVVNLGGLSHKQRRLGITTFIFVLVLLATGAWSLDHQETAGTMSLALGTDPLAYASWTALLVGKAFDKLYPPED